MIAQPQEVPNGSPPSTPSVRLEQRRYNRYVTSFRANGLGLPPGKVKGDLSVGGFGLKVPNEPKVGAVSKVTLELGALALKVEARCAWFEPVEDGFQVGFEFVELTEVQTRQLKCFLR